MFVDVVEALGQATGLLIQRPWLAHAAEGLLLALLEDSVERPQMLGLLGGLLHRVRDQVDLDAADQLACSINVRNGDSHLLFHGQFLLVDAVVSQVLAVGRLPEDVG